MRHLPKRHGRAVTRVAELGGGQFSARLRLRGMERSPSHGRQVARVALRKAEAARALGVSEDYLEHHILPEVRAVRRGRVVLIAPAELERWVERNATRGALDGGLS